ncbi:MAG: GNAT family N-acetyltransferase [Clostridiaceae bacterium]|nr:GNAT family N-acetyltransferase [Clostridiaceae bacterium]
MNIILRLERPEDHRAVEELTREAFWGSMNHPTCEGEHLLVHKLRGLPSFVPELDYVAEVDGHIVGHVIYSMAKIVSSDGAETEVLNFGPISVLPKYKKMGIGSVLLRHTISESKRLGYRAIVFYGHPDYYPRLGFLRASTFGITSLNGKSFDALMAMPLYEGALAGVSGVYMEDPVFQIDPAEMEVFDRTFPPKEPVKLIPINRLTDKLSQNIKEVFASRRINYVSQLQSFSGAEILSWGNITEQDLKNINCMLKDLSQPEKLLPGSPILKLAEMGVQIIPLRQWPARLAECQNLLISYFSSDDLSKHDLSFLLCSQSILPEGYFMVKHDSVIGWVSLDKHIPESLQINNNQSPDIEKGLVPWISLLLVAEHERGKGYGKLLLEHARREAGRMGFSKVYAVGSPSGYYEKRDFREIAFLNIAQNTIIYEADTKE